MPAKSPSESRFLSRRALLKSLTAAPLLLRPAPFWAEFSSPPASAGTAAFPSGIEFSDVRLTPHYPSPSPLADVLKFVAPGFDEYITEKYAVEIEAVFAAWAAQWKQSPGNTAKVAESLAEVVTLSSLRAPVSETVRASFGIEVIRRKFSADPLHGPKDVLADLQSWLKPFQSIATAEFEIFAIDVKSENPLIVDISARYDFVGSGSDRRREERVGAWHMQWQRDSTSQWKVLQWQAGEETQCIAAGGFIDITQHTLGGNDSLHRHLLHGADYWRTVLDGAIGLDVYSNNGVAAGDFDNDGFDDLYICQPAGLPNRLFHNRGDGTFEDVTEKAGVGVLDNTACALFVDFDNRGLQDLLVVCGTGPLLYVNRGNGTFRLKSDAFMFANPPQGTFTHASVADYDGDGRLDVYFCMYQYYLGLDQYHYPVPYYDARNGPPNCLLHNQGGGNFVETTEAAGLNVDNDRYSFAGAWGNAGAAGLPDLFVANDFGTSQLYRNKGNGTFEVASAASHVEGVGAGMGCVWADFDNDGHQDVYVPSMWEAAGQRIAQQPRFHADASDAVREKYRRHARGNALYRNNGDGTFENVGHHAGVEMGRWSWSSGFWDFDHDGFADLYVANGYLSGAKRDDLAGFFWRQVVAKSPEDATPTPAYEHGWNAINELVRADSTWHGYARNVFFANCHNGTFAEASGAVSLDCLEDSRAFALADIDHDGRLEVILKNRNAPQLRVLKNALDRIGASISFSLRGVKSNRDAIGASITIENGSLHQTKFLQAGTGFLSQHTKELFFGIGDAHEVSSATIRWPGGQVQRFEHLPANHRIQLEEGSPAFKATAFTALHAPDASVPSDLPAEQLPHQVETWLIDPLGAPGFTLPDLAGSPVSLDSFHSHTLLLTFWSSVSPSSLDTLNTLHQRHMALQRQGLALLAINVDEAATVQQARDIATQTHFSFPVLFATNEIAGIYNLTYRFLFDRRRDLPIPVSFLIDGDGKIVKVYQGSLDCNHLGEDAASLPKTPRERQDKALPFPGSLVQDLFQRNVFTYGVAMYQHGYLQQAAASFRQVIASKPDNADAYYNLGTLYLRGNDVEQARHFLEKTLEVKPNYPEAWNNLGMIAAQQGQVDTAVRDFERALQLRPGYAIALVNLGNLYRRQHDFPAAEKFLMQALAAQPDDPEANYSLGMLYAQRGQSNLAEKYLRGAIALRPAYPEALNNLGVLFVRNSDYTHAEEQFRTAIGVAPDYEGSYLNLARLFVLESNVNQARRVLEDLLHIHPGSPGATQALDQLR